MSNVKASLYEAFRSWMLPLKEMDHIIPKEGKVVELGCGEGIIAQYLARVSTREVLGVDRNQKRLPIVKQKNLQFDCADITNYKLGRVDSIVISDVLHHLPFASQNNLLKECYKALGSKGVLVIKEINTDDKVRSRLSRFWDFVFYPLEKISFSSAKVLKSKLRKIGFEVEMKKASLLFPGSTNLYICKK